MPFPFSNQGSTFCASPMSCSDPTPRSTQYQPKHDPNHSPQPQIQPAPSYEPTPSTNPNFEPHSTAVPSLVGDLKYSTEMLSLVVGDLKHPTTPSLPVVGDPKHLTTPSLVVGDTKHSTTPSLVRDPKYSTSLVVGDLKDSTTKPAAASARIQGNSNLSAAQKINLTRVRALDEVDEKIFCKYLPANIAAIFDPPCVSIDKDNFVPPPGYTSLLNE
jgi:hypothetical protein